MEGNKQTSPGVTWHMLKTCALNIHRTCDESCGVYVKQRGCALIVIAESLVAEAAAAAVVSANTRHISCVACRHLYLESTQEPCKTCLAHPQDDYYPLWEPADAKV